MSRSPASDILRQVFPACYVRCSEDHSSALRNMTDSSGVLVPALSCVRIMLNQVRINGCCSPALSPARPLSICRVGALVGPPLSCLRQFALDIPCLMRSVNIDQLLVYSVRPLSIHSRGATGHGASTKYAARPLSIHSVRSMAWPVCPLLIYSVGSTDTRSVDAASINNCHSPALGVLLLASI